MTSLAESGSAMAATGPATAEATATSSTRRSRQMSAPSSRPSSLPAPAVIALVSRTTTIAVPYLAARFRYRLRR